MEAFLLLAACWAVVLVPIAIYANVKVARDEARLTPQERAERARLEELSENAKAEAVSALDHFVDESRATTPYAPKHPKAALFRHAWRRAKVLEDIGKTEFERKRFEWLSELIEIHYHSVAPWNDYGKVPLTLSNKQHQKIAVQERARTSSNSASSKNKVSAQHAKRSVKASQHQAPSYARYKDLYPHGVPVKTKSVLKPVCTCGCLGKANWSKVDFNYLNTCPARWERKRVERGIIAGITPLRTKPVASHYTPWDYETVVVLWEQECVDREEMKKEKAASRAKEQAELRLVEAQKRKKAEEAGWDERHSNGVEAKTASEAKYRGLRVFYGSSCAQGHNEGRLARNGECLVCRHLRSLMKRGAHPENLNETEIKQILDFYAEAQRMTKTTGVQYHVDHIKPLSSGGQHHPDNLQVITATENLRKGSTWYDSDD